MKTLYNLATGVAFRLQFLSLIFVIIVNNAKSQTECTAQVTHLLGTKTINGVVVTVTPVGIVDSDLVYCPSTTPYLSDIHMLVEGVETEVISLLLILRSVE